MNIEAMRKGLDLIERSNELLKDCCVACVHKDGEVHLVAYEEQDAKAICRGISPLWSVVRTAGQDTWRCHEYPVQLTHYKTAMVPQTIPEEVIFSETQ
jgi:hypothetical protein